MKSFVVISCTVLLIGCVALRPISGGVAKSDGAYIVGDHQSIQIEIRRAAIGTQLGRLEIILRNGSSESIDIDYAQTIIVTDVGEQIQPIEPEKASASVSTDPLSVGLVGSARARSAAGSAAGEVMRNGLGKVTIQPNSFVQGAFFFKPPAQPFRTITFEFRGIPGAPHLTFISE